MSVVHVVIRRCAGGSGGRRQCSGARPREAGDAAGGVGCEARPGEPGPGAAGAGCAPAGATEREGPWEPDAVREAGPVAGKRTALVSRHSSNVG